MPGAVVAACYAGHGSTVSLNLSYRMGLCLKKPKRTKGREGERDRVKFWGKRKTRQKLQFTNSKKKKKRKGQKEKSQMVNIQV